MTFKLRYLLLLLSGTLFVNSTILLAKSRGEAVFHQCTYCHGAKGEGNDSVAAPAIAGLPEWYVLSQLKNFRSGVRGKHPRDLPGLRMISMARTLRLDSDLTAVAKVVAELPAVKATPTFKGDVAAGKSGYAVCLACHGAQGQGNKALNAPPLTGRADWYIVSQLENFKNGRRGYDPTDAVAATMIPMAKVLNKKAMHDVAAYIQTLQ